MGHYGFVAALSLTVIGVGVLAGTRAEGWRVPAQVAGLLAAALGVTSLLATDAASSLDTLWSLAAIAWAIAFVAAAALIGRRPESTADAVPRRQGTLHLGGIHE